MTVDGRIPESKSLALAQLTVKYQLALIGALFKQLFVIVATENPPGLNIENRHAKLFCMSMGR